MKEDKCDHCGNITKTTNLFDGNTPHSDITLCKKCFMEVKQNANG